MPRRFLQLPESPVPAAIAMMAVRGYHGLPANPFDAYRTVKLTPMIPRFKTDSERGNMNHILDVLRRLLDSKPMSEAEQQVAHDIITATEDALTAVLGHSDLAKAFTDTLAGQPADEDQAPAHAEQLGATEEGHAEPLEPAPAAVEG